MKKIPFYILLLITIAFIFPVNASAISQNLSGYIYSETAGWISLSCVNTSSCNNIYYGVLQDNSGKLSGYGFSQAVGWINFNPNYGGATINPDGSMTGWLYPETKNWLRVESVKIISASELQDIIVFLQNAMNNTNLSSQSTMSLLDNLCKKFFFASECADIAK
jgi:hypothetical protein